MQYMHQYVTMNPNLINTCLTTLPDNVFCESTMGPPGWKNPKKKKNRRGGKGDSSAAAGALSSIATKNSAIEMKTFHETRKLSRENIVREKKEKRALERELTDHCDGDKKEAKRRIKHYKQAMDDDEEDIEESQESTIQDIIQAEEEVATNQAEINRIDRILNNFEG